MEQSESCDRCMRAGTEPPSAPGPTYEIRECSELGRYLVAARDIEPGEIVFRSAPIVSGLQPGSAPLCLGCYRPLPDFRCPNCGWPLCSEDCVLSLRHQPECEATARSGVQVYIRDPQRADSLYDCVILIRCLMLKRTSPEHWAMLENMEAHEGRRRPPLQRRRARALCALLKARFNIPAEEREMLRLLAVLEVNAYEVRMPATNVQAVYPVASLPEHSCVPNTFRTFERDMSVVVRAAIKIPQGNHITVTYTDILWSTPERRAHLYFSKHFLCSCERCSDSTELGSYITALRCTHSSEEEGRECGGPVLPVEPLRPPAENESDMEQDRWVCQLCRLERSGRECRDLSGSATDAVHEVDDGDETGPEDYEHLLVQLYEVLYPTHACIVDVKHTLLHLYNAAHCDKSQLARKEILCREVLCAADKLFPGISTLKGTTLFELANALVERGKRDSQHAPQKLGPRLMEALRLYSMSLNHLQFQPECQPEWCVAEQAHQKMHELQTQLLSLHPSAP